MKAPPVIITPGPDMPSVAEFCVRHEDWGVEVDARPAGSYGTWTPIQLLGGSFEVRDQ